MLVALAILATGLAVCGLALPTLSIPSTGLIVARLDSARAEAIQNGIPIIVRVGRSAFRFMPDGSIGETSPDQIVLRQGSTDAIWIVENTNRLSYAIQIDYAPGTRR